MKNNKTVTQYWSPNKFGFDFVAQLFIILIISYYNFYSNFHFLPITEGWFSAYAHYVLSGKVVYKDFYLYLTPLYLWIISVVDYIFGFSFFALRIFGLFLIITSALVLYRILRFTFSPTASFVATVTSVTYMSKGVAFISYDFTQVLTLTSLLAVYCLLTSFAALDKMPDIENTRISPPAPRLFWLNLTFAGFFASCCFLIKQSNGAFIAVGIFFGFLYILKISKFDTQSLKMAWGLFCVGAFLPLFFTYIYLFSNDALKPFVTQIVINAVAAKGGITVIFGGWLSGLLTEVLVIQLYEILHILMYLLLISHILNFAYRKWVIHGPINIRCIQNTTRDVASFALFSSLFFVVIFLAWSDSIWLRSLVAERGIFLTNYIIPLSVAWIILSLIIGLIFYIIGVRNSSVKFTVILALYALGLTFGNGTSAGLSEISAFIGLAWCIAWVLERKSLPFLGIGVIFYVTLLLFAGLCYSKFDSPYSWWGTSESDARNAVEVIDHPMLGHIYMSKVNRDNYEAIIDTLNNNDLGGDIFSFPNIPVIYLLAKRWPDSKVLVSWFDFLGDKDAEVEAERLSLKPPETIVYLQLPAEAFDAHERLFRNGLPMGQRKIMAFIQNTCLEENGYSIILKRTVSPSSTIFICKRVH